MRQTELEWKSFRVDPPLFNAGKLDAVLSAFKREWNLLSDPSLCAIFSDRLSSNQYYVCTKDPSIWKSLSREVSLQDCMPPVGIALTFIAGDESPFYR
jgi:hypothetical protein